MKPLWIEIFDCRPSSRFSAAYPDYLPAGATIDNRRMVRSSVNQDVLLALAVKDILQFKTS